MDYLEIKGGQRLNGEISVNGAKNAAVSIIPAAILAGGVCLIENLPYIEDVLTLANTMTELGAKCEFRDKHSLIIDTSCINDHRANNAPIKNIRASYYFLGALLGRFKKAEVPLPGGCNFGERPIDQHIKGLEALGAKIVIEDDMVKATVEKLTGATIYLDVISVGATINIMLAAVLAEGMTIIENAAKEPHVVDTANFLNTMGANIKGAGTDVIRISGVPKLHGGEYMIIPDQIETGTYMIAAAISGGDVTVTNMIPKHMDSLSAKLTEMNCKIIEGDDFIRIISNEPLKSANIKTMTYPGFPTDLQPQMMALLSVCQGVGIITETVWENRFQYVDELKLLGCDIVANGRQATIKGKSKLTGAKVAATDLRAGAALVIAALAATGITTIHNVKYIDRGYESIEQKLSSLGADIVRHKGHIEV